MTALFYWT